MAYTYKYPRPAVTADCIVITREAEPKVLLIQRRNPPFKGAWAAASPDSPITRFLRCSKRLTTWRISYCHLDGKECVLHAYWR